MASPTRLTGAVAVALLCVAPLGTTAYQFTRTRIPLSLPAMTPASRSAVVSLPTLNRPEDLVVVVDVLNDSPEAREVSVAVGTRAPTRVALHTARPTRVHLMLPDGEGDVSSVRVFGSNGGWRIVRAELTNFRGFSQGALSAVVVPARVSGFERPSIWFVLLAAMVLTVAGLCRPWRSSLGPRVYATLTGIVVAIIGAAWVAPLVSPYRVLLAPHTWMIAMIIVYAPAVERVSAPLIRRVASAWRRAAADLREVLAAAAPETTTLASNRDLVVLYASGLVLCALFSSPRMVGDGPEYVGMAAAFRSLRWPPLELSDHFWLYPALAVPLVTLADFTSLGPQTGFFALNALLLVSAFAITVSRFGRAPSVLLFAGPIVWWIDKVHPEALMFSMLAMAVAFLRDRPWWSFITLGFAAAQNPAVAPLVPIAVAFAVSGRIAVWKDARFWVGLGIGSASTILHPLYFLARGSAPIPLLPSSSFSWPSASRYFAVLLDSNIGLVYAFPGLIVALCLAIWSRSDRWRPTRDDLFAVAGAIVLLFGFAQPWNINHGGTRDVSRYAIWLLPLTAPWLDLPPKESAIRRAMAVLCCLSATLSLAWFHPGLQEQFLRPTRAATMLWTYLPAWTHPMPEVFVERLQGAEGPWQLPIGTAGCEKLLLAGRDGGPPGWPARCRAVDVPEPCARPGVLCYANKTGDGYVFDVASGPR